MTLPPDADSYLGRELQDLRLLKRERGVATFVGEDSTGARMVLKTAAAARERELARTQIDPTSLIFEVTETAAIANMDAAHAFADTLTQLGCRFALDDFGTGFGSFYYLKHLPVSYLKIDGEFIEGLAASETDQLMVQAIVSELWLSAPATARRASPSR